MKGRNSLGWNRVPMPVVCGMVALSVSLAGCGGDDGPPERPSADVSGQVTFKGDPVTEGKVIFEDAKTGTIKGAELGPEGKFQIAKVPEAKYAVYIVPKEPAPPSDDPAAKLPEATAPNIPKKYHTPRTSGFAAQVKAGEEANDFTFKMEG